MVGNSTSTNSKWKQMWADGSKCSSKGNQAETIKAIFWQLSFSSLRRTSCRTSSACPLPNVYSIASENRHNLTPKKSERTGSNLKKLNLNKVHFWQLPVFVTRRESVLCQCTAVETPVDANPVTQAERVRFWVLKKVMKKCSNKNSFKKVQWRHQSIPTQSRSPRE